MADRFPLYDVVIEVTLTSTAGSAVRELKVESISLPGCIALGNGGIETMILQARDIIHGNTT
jgi:hypothetical protein